METKKIMCKVLRYCVALMVLLTVQFAYGQQKKSRLDSIQSVGEVVVTSRLTFREVIP